MKVVIEFEVPRSTGVDYDKETLGNWLAEQTRGIRINRFVENWKISTDFEESPAERYIRMQDRPMRFPGTREELNAFLDEIIGQYI